MVDPSTEQPPGCKDACNGAFPVLTQDSFGLYPFCSTLFDRWMGALTHPLSPYRHERAALESKKASLACRAERLDNYTLHPLCRALLTQWEKGREGAFAPSWCALDLIRIDPPATLLRCTMVEVIGDPSGGNPIGIDQSRFVFRFFGSWHVSLHGRDLTNQAVDKIDSSKYRDSLLTEYRQTIAARTPLVFGCTPLGSLGVPCGCQTIQLPLSEDGHRISAVVSATAIPEGERHATLLFREKWRGE